MKGIKWVVVISGVAASLAIIYFYYNALAHDGWERKAVFFLADFFYSGIITLACLFVVGALLIAIGRKILPPYFETYLRQTERGGMALIGFLLLVLVVGQSLTQLIHGDGNIIIHMVLAILIAVVPRIYRYWDNLVDRHV